MNSSTSATVPATHVTNGSTVAPLTGDMVGVKGKVIGHGWTPGGVVLTIQFKTTVKQLFASACEVLELYQPFVRRSSCGRFTLVSECCPVENRPGLIQIDAGEYAYVVVPTHSPEVLVTYRLVKLHDKKADPDGHTVTILRNGDDCTCADFVYRSGPEGRACKHLSAVRALDLVPAQPAEQTIPEDESNPFIGLPLEVWDAGTPAF